MSNTFTYDLPLIQNGDTIILKAFANCRSKFSVRLVNKKTGATIGDALVKDSNEELYKELQTLHKLNEVWNQAFNGNNYHYKREKLLDDQMHPSKDGENYDYIGLEDYEFGDVTRYDIENYANGLKFDSIDDDLFAFNLAAKEILTEAVELDTFKQAKNPLLNE